jgi:hypothetical protein
MHRIVGSFILSIALLFAQDIAAQSKTAAAKPKKGDTAPTLTKSVVKKAATKKAAEKAATGKAKKKGV